MRTILGVDDTDSRTRGMCTTYVGARIVAALRDDGHRVSKPRLLRLNPSIEHKTRGNAAVAIETSASPDEAVAIATDLVAAYAVTEDPATNPGIAAVDAEAAADLSTQTWETIRDVVPPALAIARLEAVGARTWSAGTGRGLVGAAAALGARSAIDEWTVELIAYRHPERRGTDRSVDHDAALDAAEATYPLTWDTADLTANEVVCTPHTPGPVLYGLRGDTPGAVRTAAAMLETEPVERRVLFVTNQGTDAHIRPAPPEAVTDGRSYAVTGRVASRPETKRGGHVHLRLAGSTGSIPCVAFEPTKRFRDRVRDLGPGDTVTACGEVTDGTLKLEKFALQAPRRYRRSVPTCPQCGERMESAGRDQGYRCRPCGASAPGHRLESTDHPLEPGWYEVPPVARRHLARPLVRGGFSGPVHPER